MTELPLYDVKGWNGFRKPSHVEIFVTGFGIV